MLAGARFTRDGGLTRLARRRPRLLMVLLFQVAYLVVLGGMGLFSLYQPMSVGKFWLLVAGAEAIVLVENLLSIKVMLKLWRPVRAWQLGAREESATVAAWRALTAFPSDYARRFGTIPVILQFAGFAAFATALLGLSWYAGIVIFVGAALTLAYGLIIRLFGIAALLRPTLEEVAAGLPDGFDLGTPAVPLRWRLLIALPIINVITGVVVAGLSQHGHHARLADFGVSIVAAVAVAFTISFELTLLVTRGILRPLDELRRATARVARGDLSARVPVVSNDETGELAQAFNEMVAGLEERRRLHEALGAYVDPHVAERVLREGSDLGGEEVEVSILFLDIREFTTFAERSSAREVVTRLNEFYDVVVPILRRHGGHADKFLADGILGVFGAPERQHDHADRAVAAALEVLLALRERFRGAVDIGIGINSGPVVAGTVGGGGRVEFTVIGDAVNTASRVESLTRETGDGLLITEATRCLLTRELSAFEERPSVPLKGKSETVRIWAPVLEAPGAGQRLGVVPAAD